jgi:hypothetical protein
MARQPGKVVRSTSRMRRTGTPALGAIALLVLVAGLAQPAHLFGVAIAAPAVLPGASAAGATTAALVEAVLAGDDQRIRELVAAGADPNAVDSRGTPLLQRAMRREDHSVYRLLIELGADPTRGDRDGRTALHLATMGRSSFWLEDLLGRGLSPDLPNTITDAPPLFDALRARLRRNVDRLLEAGARLDVRDRSGTTPLHQAALVKDTASVLKFLEAGADADAVDRLGARFRDYLYDGDRSVLHGAERRRLEKIDAWLAAHDAARATRTTSERALRSDPGPALRRAPEPALRPVPESALRPAPEPALRPTSGQQVLEGDFRIGPTGIRCVKAPCPWRGIVSLNADGPRARWPIWSGEELPPISGSDADRERIANAWRDRACLIVEGRFAEGALAVHRIKGDC